MAGGEFATVYGVGRYVASESHTAVVPLRYRPDGTRPLILYAPSRGNTSIQAKAAGWFDEVIAALAMAGYIVLAGDLGGTTVWGSPTAQSRLTSLKTYGQGTLGAKAGPVGLLATSMGTPAILNWAKNNLSSAACAAASVALPDLGYEYANNVNGYAAEISTAHGGAPSSANDPMQNTAALAPLPMKMWFANNDAVAPTARAQAFVDATGCQSASLGAVGHQPSSTPPADVVAFFQANL